jgi:hypothetical protein
VIFENLMVRYDGTAGEPADKWRALMQAIGVLLTRSGGLPAELQPRLIQINAAWDADSADAALLRSAKLECWAYLKAKHGNSTTIADKEDRAVRAMLCLLEPGGDAVAASDTANWAAEMLVANL